MKKLLAVLLALFFVFNMASCGKEEAPAGDNGPAEPAGGAAPVEQSAGDGRTMPSQYSQEIYPFPGGVTVKGVARQGSRLLFLGQSEEKYLLALASYETAANGRVTVSEAKTLELGSGAADEALVYGITAGGDGAFYALTGNSAEAEQRDYALLRYTENGEFDGKITVSAWDKAPVQSFQVDSQGEPVLLGEGYAAVLSPEGELKSCADTELTAIFSSALTGQGVVFTGFTQLFEGDSPFYLLEPSTGIVSKKNLSNPDEESWIVTGSVSQVQGLDGEYIVDTSRSFMLTDLEGDSYEELLRYSYDGSYSCQACRLGESSFLYAQGSGSAVVTGMEEVPYVEKSTVRVAMVSNWMDMDTGILQSLNNGSGPYRYEAQVYGKDEVDKLTTELGAGRAPDLVLFYDNVNTCSELYEDLYPYIDADPDLKREDFLPGLLEAASGGGALRQLWDYVVIDTLAARESDVGEGLGLSPEDYNRILAENENYTAIFETFISKTGLLGHAARVGIAKCVDKENAECHFDDPGFRDLLAWTKDMGDDIPEGADVPYPHADEIVLKYAVIQSPGGFAACDRAFDQPGVYVGFPDGGDGCSYYNNMGNAGLCMAIPAGSQNKEGAWAFIKERLSLESQSDHDDLGIPVIYEAARRQAEAALDGRGLACMDQLLSRTKYAQAYADQALMDIIRECGQSYLAGDKSIDETVALIQSRAAIYVSEQYG